MLDSNRVHEVLSEICNSISPKRNGGYKCRCPICGDSEKNLNMKRLHVDWYQKYEKWMGYCYNGGCECRGMDIYSLYSHVKGISFGQAKGYIDQSVYDTEEIKKRLFTKTCSVSASIDEKDQHLDIDIERECLSLNDVTTDRIYNRYLDALREFVSSRKIPNECFVAHSGRYKSRIIVPIYEDGKLVYFQGRAIDKSMEPKYLNPVVDKSGIIMNIKKFDRNKSIVITEGILDAWMVEDNQGTSVLGAHFDDDIIAKLLKLTDRDVILCFDNPYIDTAGREEIKKFIDTSVFKNKVRYFLPDRKDFKDLNELRLIYDGSIYDYVVDNSFSLLNIVVKLSLKL